MTRKKVKLAYITNDSARKATFKKRQKGLMKKVDELSKLCGIEACAIVYSPYDPQPQVWPTSPAGVQSVLSDFRMLPEMDKSKKMMNQESYLRQRISKALDQLRRQRNDNREKELTELMYHCLVGNMGLFHLNSVDLNDLGGIIDQFLKEVNRRAEILRKSDNAESSGGAAAAAAAVTTMTAAGTDTRQDYQTGSVYSQTGTSMTTVDQMEKHQQQWCVELMNHSDQMNFAAEEMCFPSMYNNSSSNSNTTATAASAAASNSTNHAGTSVWSSGFFR